MNAHPLPVRTLDFESHTWRAPQRLSPLRPGAMHLESLPEMGLFAMKDHHATAPSPRTD